MRDLQGICIEITTSTNLEKGEVYYLFPHGPTAFHASRFPRPGSHFGTYQRRYFEIIDKSKEEWPPEPPKPLEILALDKDKIYEAQMVWRSKGYSYGTDLGIYYIKPVGLSDCYFYRDAALLHPKGRFPLHWFENIREYGEESEKELPQDQWQQIDMFSI